MIRGMAKMGLLLTALCGLTPPVLNAYCSKCTKIEEKRAQEQAEHPQPWLYYDDQIGLHKNEDDSANNGNQSPPENQSDSSKGMLINHSLALLAASDTIQNGTYLKDQTDATPIRHYEIYPSPPDLPFKEEFFEENNAFRDGNPSEKTQNFRENSFKNGQKTTIPSSSSYSTINTILKTRDFLETLDGSFTLFIPSNEALAKLPPGTLFELARAENQEKLAALVSNHVVARKILKNDFETYRNREIKAISGRNLTIGIRNGSLIVDDAQILRIEPAGYDGVIYIIDQVLLP